MNTSCKCNETKINDQGSLSKRLAIHRLEIYPVDSVIHLSINLLFFGKRRFCESHEGESKSDGCTALLPSPPPPPQRAASVNLNELDSSSPSPPPTPFLVNGNLRIMLQSKYIFIKIIIYNSSESNLLFSCYT